MENYLEIEDLSCGYQSGFRLQVPTLLLPRGTFAGIIGRNGSGKSTLFKGLVGDLRLSGGVVRLNGTDLNSLSPNQRARSIAIVSQFMELSSITVLEYVLMGRIPYRRKFQFSYLNKDICIATKCIDLVGITHLKDKLITELSGGEQQMTAIASALAQEPDLLLLDEPTSHLDITYQSKIMNLLQRLNEETGLTVVMIVHDLNLASEYCNHLTLMKKGQVLHQGTPQQVLTYQNIESAYDTVVVVKNNPISGKPVIFPVSQYSIDTYNNKQQL